jgi:hypothetical protein
MSIYDDYSNPYTSPVATAAGYQVPQTAGYPSPQGSSAAAPQSPVYYQGPAPSAPPPGGGAGSWGGSWGGLGGAVQGLANGVADAINNHPLTLMALGAGIAQGGVGRGLAYASSAAQAERNLQAQQVNHAHVLNALTGAGVPPDEALAAVLNPSLMRVLAVKYLAPRAGGNATGAAPAPGSAASYPPNVANVAPSNMPTAWPTLGRATATMNTSAVPTAAEPGLPGAPPLRADAVPQTRTPAVPGTPQVTFPNPFDFSNTDFRSIILRNLWNKLWHDPRPLQSNPFFLETPDPGPEMLNPNPMGPPNPLIPPKTP